MKRQAVVNMIVVTDQAKDLFCGIKHPEDRAVRLDLAENEALHDRSGERQIRLAVGKSREDDRIALPDCEEVLRISRDTSEAFDGCGLKPLETAEGTGFSVAPQEACRDAAS
jgi:hypothetical protein